jgi:hypothetical protein
MQLRRLLLGFNFPREFHYSGYAFSGEEILLAGLYRLHSINVFGDAGWIETFGWSQSKCSYAFSMYCKHILPYFKLITDSLHIWTPYLSEFADKIRRKLRKLGLNHLIPAHNENGFNICGFIDNKVICTCRPGGGPTVNCQRNDPLLQRSFYNGWKKEHGIKFQTCDLPNGLNLHVWGPASVRHNDIETLEFSDISNKLAIAQQGAHRQFKIYGDSAYQYVVDDHIASRYINATGQLAFTNECLSSCRECIEWHYGPAEL